MKVLLYTQHGTSRLQYISHFIFEELMGVDCIITVDREAFESYDGVKIDYYQDLVLETGFHLFAVDLLFEEDIVAHPIEWFEVLGHKAFFKTLNSDFPFDIFAASFYLLSRYEEYLPHTKDMYGRYAHENSLAFKNNFLHLPLINIWVHNFAASLQNKFPSFTFAWRPFKFIPTYDIDIAFSYKHKGLKRNIGGFFKSPSLERIMILSGVGKDPFDSYDWLNALHEKYQLNPIYFFLLAAKNRMYDKNILPVNKALRKLIKWHAEKYTIGIHPSWQSGDDTSLLKKEIAQLKTKSGQKITFSRQHYIRFNLPGSYRLLIENQITEDYSMGYGSINGFRASVASSFFWYDLQKDEATSLRIHPFCFMEANSFYEQHYTAAQAYDELLHYYQACKNVNGQLITIWHNNFLGTAQQFAGWREVYKKFIALVCNSELDNLQ